MPPSRPALFCVPSPGRETIGVQTPQSHVLPIEPGSAECELNILSAFRCVASENEGHVRHLSAAPGAPMTDERGGNGPALLVHRFAAPTRQLSGTLRYSALPVCDGPHGF
jgi:hypothetical protein